MSTKARIAWRTARRVVASIVIVGAAFWLAPPSLAQGLTNAFGGFAASPDAPIDIAAKRLDVDDAAKRAVFTGDVIAQQDTFRMTSTTLEIRYAPRKGGKAAQARDADGAFGGGSTEITELIARGNVFVKSAKQELQTAEGDWARFDVKTRVITMGDTVTLKQGKNVIRGTRLVINLNTGKSSVLSAPATADATTATRRSNGRIRMVITPDKSLRQGLGGNRNAPRTRRRAPNTTSASQPVRTGRGE
ncbi:MAG: LptA/OstA family protein [Pseudomonadota bacterium]